MASPPCFPAREQAPPTADLVWHCEINRMWQKGHSETEDLKLHLKKPCSFYMESLGMITLGNTSLRTQSLCHEEDRQTERKKEKAHLTCVLWLLMNG